MTTHDLLEAVRELARADRQLLNAQGMLTASWAKGEGSAKLVEVKKAAEEEFHRRKEMLFLVAGTLEIERRKREEASNGAHG